MIESASALAPLDGVGVRACIVLVTLYAPVYRVEMSE